MNVNRKQKKVLGKSIFFVSIIISLLIFLVLINTDYKYKSDIQKAKEYSPTPEMTQLVSEMFLIDKGKNILYASSPQLKDRVSFNGICGDDGDPNTYIAGCYYEINGNEYIDIFNSGKDASILENSYYNYDNSKIVTLAHEMMHAVYARIDESNKNWIDIETNKIFQMNSHLRDELKNYSQDHRGSELFSRVATEIYDIPSKLQEIYSEYFKDRSYIVRLYYDNKSQLIEMFAQADLILKKMETQRSLYYSNANYNTRKKALDEYNRLVDVYNSLIGIYRKVQDKLDSNK